MSQTLGQRYDELIVKISTTEDGQRYQKGENSVDRGILFRLYDERSRVLEDISIYGRNYTLGQNTEPMGDTSLVSFS